MAIEIEHSIVESLKTLIEREVYHRSTPNKVFEEKYSHLTSDIEFELSRAQESYNELKADGLTANTIEAEGYLRALRWVESSIKYVDEIHNEDRGDK